MDRLQNNVHFCQGDAEGPLGGSYLNKLDDSPLENNDDLHLWSGVRLG